MDLVRLPIYLMAVPFLNQIHHTYTTTGAYKNIFIIRLHK